MQSGGKISRHHGGWDARGKFPHVITTAQRIGWEMGLGCEAWNFLAGLEEARASTD